MTYLEKIVTAIVALKGRKGSSRQAIRKQLESTGVTVNATAFRAAFKKGVADGTLSQDGQTFKVIAKPAAKKKKPAKKKTAKKTAKKKTSKKKGSAKKKTTKKAAAAPSGDGAAA